MKMHLERSFAAKLYLALGQDLWLNSITSSALTDEEKLEALKTWKETIEVEIGLRNLSQLQDSVYCLLASKDAHIQEQTSALKDVSRPIEDVIDFGKGRLTSANDQQSTWYQGPR